MNILIAELRRRLMLTIDSIGAHLRHRFYIYLAALLTLVAIGDFFTTNLIVGMRNRFFDMMVRYRLEVKPPSSDIVIVDIDEKSLAAMASEFGRWPWPRQVFGEFVEKLNSQNPSAIVFDILFSDPDVYNGESDAYFDDAIRQTSNTWFPMIRLPRSADTASRINPAQVPGARPIGSPDSGSSVAVILPFFKSIQQSARLGFNNIMPDDDGVSREYPIRYFEGGYALPSLPLAVSRGLDSSIKVPDRILLNWRGPPFTYRHISFSDIYEDMRIEHPLRPADEFSGKIVIVGSTAPSLFDLKVTAIDRQFPGVEILATAIDNLRSGDWLRVPEISIVYLIITLAILWITTFGFYRTGTGGKLNQFYGLSQFFLIAFAYAVINLLDVYINLTGPVMFGFIYYSLARSYSLATARSLDNSVALVRASKGVSRGYVLLFHFDLPTREEALISQLGRILVARCKQQPSAEWLCGRQTGMWRHLENVLLLCWRAEGGAKERIEAIRLEAEAIRSSVRQVLTEKPIAGALPPDRLIMKHAEGDIGKAAQEDWLLLLAQALTQSEAPPPQAVASGTRQSRGTEERRDSAAA